MDILSAPNVTPVLLRMSKDLFVVASLNAMLDFILPSTTKLDSISVANVLIIVKPVVFQPTQLLQQ
jgi:hypothetical protein